MINLMPPAQKEAILYARRNSLLIRWATGIAVAATGLVLVTGAGLFYIRQDSKAYQQSINQTKTYLASQKEADVTKRAEEMSGNLQLAVTMLSKEVLFSRLLQSMGQLLPPGTILEDLTLDNTLAGGIDLQIGAVNYQAGVQIQANLSDPANQVFERADIGEVSCPSSSTDAYPCKIEVRALFASDNSPFLKLNQGAKP